MVVCLFAEEFDVRVYSYEGLQSFLVKKSRPKIRETLLPVTSLMEMEMRVAMMMMMIMIMMMMMTLKTMKIN